MTAARLTECIIINTVFIGSLAVIIDKTVNAIDVRITAIKHIKSQLKLLFCIHFTSSEHSNAYKRNCEKHRGQRCRRRDYNVDFILFHGFLAWLIIW